MPVILVADDNPVSLHFFADALAAHAITCECAEDGRAAVDLATARRFDLLLLDARMPHYDGVQALALIRTGNGASRSTPAVATTAADRGQHADLLKQGFAEVLAKPTTLAEVRGMLMRHLPAFARVQNGLRQNSVNEEHIQPHGFGQDFLDDGQALMSSGGDRLIMQALRGLLTTELEALAGEFDGFSQHTDRGGVYERLHRLDASAGFCGTPQLADAAKRLRQQLDQHAAWPDASVIDFLQTASRTLAALRHQSLNVPLAPEE